MGDLAELNDAFGRAGSYAGLAVRGRHVGPGAGRRDAALPGAGDGHHHPHPVPRARVGRGRRRPGRRAARLRRARLLPLLPRVGSPLPPAPAHRARGEDPQREAASRAPRRGAGCSTSSRSAIVVDLPDGPTSLEQGLSAGWAHPIARSDRRLAAEAVTVGLEPGLRTRAFVFNTLMADKATDDRLRHYDSWIASRNLLERGQRRVGPGPRRLPWWPATTSPSAGTG